MLPVTLNSSFVNDFLGHFDSLFNDISHNDISFPKYNVIKNSDTNITIELALAGYSKGDIKISVKNNILVVEGDKVYDDSKEYIHRHIASRSFKKKWTLPRNVEVKDANFKDGILSIDCELIIPEEEKPKLIDIN